MASAGFRWPTALPPLSGWRFVAYRLAWAVALAIAVVGWLGGPHWQNVDYRRAAWDFHSLGLRTAGGARMAPPVGDAARAMRIGPGDTIVQIGDWTVPKPISSRIVAERLRGPMGKPIDVRIRHEDGVVRDHRLWRGPQHLAQDYSRSPIGFSTRIAIEQVVRFLSGAIMIAAAVLLFLRKPRDPVAACLSLAFLCLTVDTAGTEYLLGSFRLDLLKLAMNTAGYALLLIGLAAFPQGRFEPRWTAAIPLLVLLWVGFRFARHYQIITASWFSVTMAGNALLIAALAAVFIRYRKVSDEAGRQQIRWALFGFAVGAIVYVATIVGLELTREAGGYYRLIWSLVGAIVTGIAITIFAVGMLIALLRYRLYDAEAAISRSAGLAVLTLTLGAVFAASAKLMEVFFEGALGRDAGVVPGAVGAGLAVILFTPTHHAIQRWAERRFQKDMLRLRNRLPEVVGDLRETSAMSALLDEVLARVEAGTRATRSAVMIDGKLAAARGVEPGQVDAAAFPLHVPLDAGERDRVGTLLVGPRPDGSAPGKDERDALQVIADPVARAIRVVGARERREAAIERRLRAIERRLEAVMPAKPTAKPRSRRQSVPA